MSHRLASAFLVFACLLTLAACATDPEPEPEPDPTLTAIFSSATHDQLGISLYTAADLVDVELYKYMVFMASIGAPTCEPMVSPGDVTFVHCSSISGSARAQNSSLTWPREGARADLANAEILTATALDLGGELYDGVVVRSSPAGAVELGDEVSIESTIHFEHPWANSDSAMQTTELPDGVSPGVHYLIEDTSRASVGGVGRFAVRGDLRVAYAVNGSGFDLDGWLELRGAETLRATLRSTDECTPLSIDGNAIAPLCRW